VGSAEAGTTVTLTVKPAAGYRLKDGSLTVNGGAIAGTTFTMPGANVTVSAVFEPIPEGAGPEYAVKVGEFTNGSVTAGRAKARAGVSVTLTVNADAGYGLKAGTLKVTGADGGAVAVTGSGTTYTFTMPGSDVTVSGAEFEKLSGGVYTVGIEPPQNGTINANPASAEAGTTITLTVTANTTWKLQGNPTVTKAGGGAVTVTNSGNTYTFDMPAANVTVSGTFVPDYTANIAEFGQTAGDKSEIIFERTDESLTMTVTEQSTVYFTASRQAAQTITKGGTDAAKVTIHNSGTVNGTTAGAELAVVSVNTADLVFDGGTRNFTLTVSEDGKAPRTVTAAVKLDPERNHTGAAVFKVDWNPAPATPYEDLDPALANGKAALERIDTGTPAAFTGFQGALQWVLDNAEAHTDYLIRVEGDELVPRIGFAANGKANVTLRLRGTKDGPWDLKHDGSTGSIYSGTNPTSIDGFITLNKTSPSQLITFILENNITVKGAQNSTQYRSLISVGYNATLVMKKGSKITGHVTNTANYSASPIFIPGANPNASRDPALHGHIRIEGGSITDCDFDDVGRKHLIYFERAEGLTSLGAFYKAASTEENPIIINNNKKDNTVSFYANASPYYVEYDLTVPTVISLPEK
jgi:hypothetical protein